MKIFTNKNLIQKLVIALVCVTLLNFCFAPKVRADFGGKMMSYVRDFATALADVAISVMQFGVTGEWTYAVDNKGTATTDSKVDYWIKDSKIQYPIIQLSPELVFADKIELLSVDFIGGSSGKEYTLKTDSTALSTLRTLIASWYVTLRTIAIVGLLSVLIYVGIRIMISSTSQDRAKYKQRLVDWIIAFCLLFFMHYIMAATVNVVGKVNSVLGDNLVSKGITLNSEYGNVKYNPASASTTVKTGYIKQNIVDWFANKGITLDDTNPPQESAYAPSSPVIYYYSFKVGGVTQAELCWTTSDPYLGGWAGGSLTQDEVDELKEIVKNPTIPSTSGSAVGLDKNVSKVTAANGKDIIVDSNSINTGSSILYYINYARLYLNVSTDAEYIPISVGYLIIYMVLVVFTGMFVFRYMKRVIYVAFLTMMAPMVALTYPLDKIKDGKAQAFNMWFKEYLLNVLIQPVHLLLYSVLVGGAMELVSANVIYAIVAIGFMVPAEKLIRKFFGFDNAGTLSAAGSFAGGAVFSAMINKMNRPKPGKGGPGGEKEGPRPVRKANSDGGGVDANAALTGAGAATSSVPRASSGGGTGGSGGTGDGAPAGAGTGGGAPTGPTASPTGSGGTGSGTGGGAGGSSGSSPADWKKDNKITVWDRMRKQGSIGDAARAVGYRYQNKIKNGAKSLPGKFRRAAIGGIVGGGTALAGAAVGIASGDASKAFQYAAAGGAAGYYGANYYGDKLAKEVIGASKDAEAAFWGKDAKQRNQYLFDKEFKSNPENINAIAKALGSRSEATKAMKDGRVQALLNNGVTDPGKVAKALKLQQDYMKAPDRKHPNYMGLNENAALERAVSVAKWNRDAGMGVYETNSRARESFIKRTMEQVQEGTPGLSDADARSRVEQILAEMEYFET